MKKIGVLLQCIISLAVGYISSVYVAIGFVMMTNTGKLGNELEGSGMLQLIGVLMLAVWGTIIYFMNYYIGRKLVIRYRKLVLVCNLALVMIGIVIKILMQ